MQLFPTRPPVKLFMAGAMPICGSSFNAVQLEGAAAPRAREI
jgi:hypothetical protein